MSYISSVKVNGTASNKMARFLYRYLKIQKVIFFTGLTLSDTVVITYGETSSDWIFPDKPKRNLMLSHSHE